MHTPLFRKTIATVLMTGTTVAGIVAFSPETASAQNRNYFVEKDYVRIHSGTTRGSETTGVIPPNRAITPIDCFTYGERVEGINVWWKGNFPWGTGYVPAAWDTSSFRSESDISNKYGIGKCGSSNNTPPSRPSGRGNFANASVADYMLARNGQQMGQCRDAVNKTVYSLSNGTMQLGGEPNDYQAGYRRVGAYQVPNIDSAVKGDIVNIGQGTHTYVIVQNRGGGNLRVVDSNHGYDERVMTYDRQYNYNGYASQSTIWRVGKA